MRTLAAIERFWLTPHALPLRERIAADPWHADAPGDYCDRCGQRVGLAEIDEFGCAACRGQRLPWDRLVRLGAYEDRLASWVQEIKFGRFARLGIDLGRELGAAARDAGFPTHRACVVPMPSSWRRRQARGIDHAAVIAEGAARELGLPLVHALRRLHRPSQRALNKASRAANVRGSVLPRTGIDLAGWAVLLVDDVATSGSSLRAAAKALRTTAPAQHKDPARLRRTLRGGWGGPAATVWAAVLAVTPASERRHDAQATVSQEVEKQGA